jgi:hypothetical protein
MNSLNHYHKFYVWISHYADALCREPVGHRDHQ